MAVVQFSGPLGEGVAVISQESSGLVALAKPAGVLSHPNRVGDRERSLLVCDYSAEGEYYYWKEGAKEQRAWLLNRLDSATSGLLLLATNQELADTIRTLFQKKQVYKLYNALVFGVPHAAQQNWRDFLAVEKKGGQIRTSTQGHIPSEAQMRVLRQWRGNPSIALIELNPKTGRSHQLRVQCTKRHLPIVGDATYGDFALNRIWAKETGEKRLYLHSVSTRFEYEWKGKKLRFSAEAPLPKEFTSVGR